VKDPRFDKFILLSNGLVPFILLLWDARHHRLGTNPVEFALHATGMLALIFLTLTLTITPLRKFTGWNYLSHFRRMLGLFAFFYASLHFTIYFIFQQNKSVAAAMLDVLNRSFILFGMTALILMVPLAATSTNWSIRKLGAEPWKKIHKLVYWSAGAAGLHYLKFPKADTRLPLIFGGILVSLLGYRLLVKRFPNLHCRRPQPVTPIPSVSLSDAKH